MRSFIIKNDSSTAVPQSEKTDGFCEHRRVIDEPAVKIAMRDQVLAIATGEDACKGDRERGCRGSGLKLD